MLTCKGNLILQADVELLEKEVLPDRDLTANETTIKLENKIDDQTREMNCLYEINKTKLVIGNLLRPNIHSCAHKCVNAVPHPTIVRYRNLRLPYNNMKIIHRISPSY